VNLPFEQAAKVPRTTMLTAQSENLDVMI